MQAFFLQTVTFQNKTYASKKKKNLRSSKYVKCQRPEVVLESRSRWRFLKAKPTNQIGPLEMENKDSISNCAHGLIQRNTQISILIAPKDVHTLLVSWSATQDFFFC